MGRKKFDTVDDVPKDFFDKHKTIYAFVERVIDGDTIRVRHVPGYNWRRWKTPQPLQTRGIANQTLSIRIYGVDCPEIAKFGKPGQPFAEQAKEFTTRCVGHCMVRITFLRKDQYRRAVCQVETVPFAILSWLPSFRSKDLSVQLATAGLAELYTGGGAEYCNNRELLERRIERAKQRGKGIWSMGDTRVSAAEFKQQARRETAGTNRKSKSGSKLLDTVVTGLELSVG